MTIPFNVTKIATSIEFEDGVVRGCLGITQFSINVSFVGHSPCRVTIYALYTTSIHFMSFGKLIT